MDDEKKIKKSNIPYFAEINDFLASVPVGQRTTDPLFYCFRLKEADATIMYKPPFRRGFHYLGLLTNAERTRITYDAEYATNLNSLIVFQSPGLIYSFYRDSATYGYIVYFKLGCFSYFNRPFEQEFPFFNCHHTDFYSIDPDQFKALSVDFEEIFLAYESSNDHTISSLKLLAVLYRLKELSIFNDVLQEKKTSITGILFKRFTTLVNRYYIEKRRVDDYAAMLHVTPNHLSQSVKSVSGKNALSYINDRLMAEAKSLIRYTDLNLAEITYKLGFSDPANFNKFFKKHTGLTPLIYRRKETN